MDPILNFLNGYQVVSKPVTEKPTSLSHPTKWKCQFTLLNSCVHSDLLLSPLPCFSLNSIFNMEMAKKKPNNSREQH